MTSLNILNPPATPRLVDGLQPWLPEDELRAPHNIAAFTAALPELKTLSLWHKPADEEIFVLGNDHVAYGVVDWITVRSLSASLGLLYSRGTRIPYQAFRDRNKRLSSDYQQTFEEARARLLQRTLGVAALRQAAHATSARQFKRASADATRVIAMPYHPTVSRATRIDVQESDQNLLYYFKRAARTYRTMSEADAQKLILGIASMSQDGAQWYQIGGATLQGSIGYSDKRVNKQPSAKIVRRTKTAEALSYLIAKYKPTDESTFVYDHNLGAYERTYFSRYAEYLGYQEKDGQPEDQLAQIYEDHVKGTALQFPPIKPAGEVPLALNLGIRAYLRAGRGNPVADSIAEALDPLDPKKLLPTILLGNLVIKKMIASKTVPYKFRNEPPGFNDQALGACFDALRKLIHLETGGREKGVVKQLGAVVSEHIKQAL